MDLLLLHSTAIATGAAAAAVSSSSSSSSSSASLSASPLASARLRHRHHHHRRRRLWPPPPYLAPPRLRSPSGSSEAEHLQSVARNIKKPQPWKLLDRPVLRRSGGLTCQATTRSVGDEQDPSRDSVPAAASTIPLYFPPWLDAFYRFTRPHTVIGTALGIVSISLLSIQSLADFSSTFAIGLLQALIPALCMNFYIVGLNQIYDIEIDKVNKPILPLASGEFSLKTGIAIVISFAVLSLGMGVYIGSRPLLWALTVSFILGTAYSMELPFLRWKRSAFAAATCILSVRAIVVQLAFYLHMQTFVFQRAAILTRPLVFATGFMCFFSVVIALFKDIPDLEGDRVFGIQSYTVRLGQERVFWLCIYLLLAAYGVAILIGTSCDVIWCRIVMVLGHAALANILWNHAKNIDLKSKSAITNFYMFVWKLFYAEYLLIPLMR